MKQIGILVLCLTLVLSGCSLVSRRAEPTPPPAESQAETEDTDPVAATAEAFAQQQLPPEAAPGTAPAAKDGAGPAQTGDPSDGTASAAGASQAGAAAPANTGAGSTAEAGTDAATGPSDRARTAVESGLAIDPQFADRKPLERLTLVPVGDLGLNCKAYLSDGAVSLDRLAIRLGQPFEIHLVCMDFSHKPEDYDMTTLIVWPTGVYKESALDYVTPPPEAQGKGVAIWGVGMTPRTIGVYTVYVLIEGQAVAEMPLHVNAD